MIFSLFDTTPKGIALYYCEYNNDYHISLEYNIATGEKKFFILHHDSGDNVYELPETFKTPEDAVKAINLRD